MQCRFPQRGTTFVLLARLETQCLYRIQCVGLERCSQMGQALLPYAPTEKLSILREENGTSSRFLDGIDDATTNRVTTSPRSGIGTSLEKGVITTDTCYKRSTTHDTTHVHGHCHETLCRRPSESRS